MNKNRQAPERVLKKNLVSSVLRADEASPLHNTGAARTQLWFWCRVTILEDAGTTSLNIM